VENRATLVLLVKIPRDVNIVSKNPRDVVLHISKNLLMSVLYVSEIPRNVGSLSEHPRDVGSLSEKSHDVGSLSENPRDVDIVSENLRVVGIVC